MFPAQNEHGIHVLKIHMPPLVDIYQITDFVKTQTETFY